MAKRNLLIRGFQILALSLVAILLADSTVKAQVSTYYVFSQTSGVYTPITGGNVLFAGTFDDDNPLQITMPSFNFNGSQYTSLYVDPNGFAGFTTSPWFGAGSYTPLSTSATIITADGVISPFGRDLTNADLGNPEISWLQVGSELVIQWQDMKRYYFSSQSERFSFQIRMDTLTGVIKCVYDSVSGTNFATGKPQVGLRGIDETFPVNINNRSITASGTWASSNAGTANSSIMAFSPPTPSSGQTYVWTPATCPAPNNLLISNITTNSASLGVTSASTPLGYIWEIVPSGAGNSATPVAQGTYIGTNLNDTTGGVLTPGTMYDAYVRLYVLGRIQVDGQILQVLLQLV